MICGASFSRSSLSALSSRLPTRPARVYAAAMPRRPPAAGPPAAANPLPPGPLPRPWPPAPQPPPLAPPPPEPPLPPPGPPPPGPPAPVPPVPGPPRNSEAMDSAEERSRGPERSPPGPMGSAASSDSSRPSKSELLLRRGRGDVRGRDERAVVDGRDGDMGDAGGRQLVAGEGLVAGGPRVAQDGQEALQLDGLHVFLDPQQAAVAPVEGPGEGPHLRGLELLARADEPVAPDPQEQGARGGQGRAHARMRGGERRRAGGVAGRIGGQIPPRRHQRGHDLGQCGRGTRFLHVWGRV